LLDSFPFCGATTTLEALWMGTPTVTLAGPGLRSGFTAYAQRKLGMNEWTAADPEEYVEKVSLAAEQPIPNPSAVREAFLRSPFMDHYGWVSALEGWYANIWRRKYQGREPRGDKTL